MITAPAPASASISAEMSPVWAPAGSAWQSWPPIITDERCAEAANSRIRVAGGHTINSALPRSSAAPDRILANSARDAANPFIFQLPATSGIELPAAIENPLTRAVSDQTGQRQRTAPRADPS